VIKKSREQSWSAKILRGFEWRGLKANTLGRGLNVGRSGDYEVWREGMVWGEEGG
jgi:hypothetical protein